MITKWQGIQKTDTLLFWIELFNMMLSHLGSSGKIIHDTHKLDSG
jgi:hypothetical protein